MRSSEQAVITDGPDDGRTAMEGFRLDPHDPVAFRATAHQVLDACLDRLEAARELPWRAPPAGLPGDLHGLPEPVPRASLPAQQLARELTELIMPQPSGNTPSRLLGSGHGTGLVENVLSDLVANAMNASGGGRHRQAIDIERRVIDWCASLHGLPEGAGGLLTSASSVATVLALQAARVHRFGPSLRLVGQSAQAVLYAAVDSHPCVAHAAELLGLGRSAVRSLPLDDATGSCCLATLAQRVEQDRAAGRTPLCLVGTAGSVDTARFDDLTALAAAAERHGLWFHVDASCGAWTVIADEPWRSLSRGLERADSMAFDFCQWPYIGHPAGAVLVRSASALADAFGESDAPWPGESGLKLSGEVCGLKIWTALRRHGIGVLGAAISDNCRQASLLGELVEASDALRLVLPVTLNVCCFELKRAGNAPDERHREIAASLQGSGQALLSTTRIGERLVLRAAFCNHRTTALDVQRLVEAVVDASRSAT